jgi:glycosyltransferase involved in cell wall biosynthesis
MFGTHHSWAVTIRSLFAEFIAMGHDPYIQSINGFSAAPKRWAEHYDKDCLEPDLDICYTAPLNFPTRFKSRAKKKMAIYNFETIPLPTMWKDSHKDIDFVLPSSNFSKKVFLDAGWPEEKCIVVPHGINPVDFKNKDKIRLINDKTFRFLNVSINHYRKNIDLLVDAYYSAFSSKDDVCLVLKTKISPPTRKPSRFECDVVGQIKKVQLDYINSGRPRDSLPQLELLEERYPTMVPLYNSCDVLVSAASAEGFGLPLLEGLAAGMLVVAPRCTGQLDFLNDNNSLLVDVKTMRADPKYQYWTISKESWTYLPIKESLAEQMRNAFENRDSLKESLSVETAKTLETFTWENAAKQILEI